MHSGYDMYIYIALQMFCHIKMFLPSSDNRDRDLTDMDCERELRQAEIGEVRPLCDDYLDHDEDLLDEDSMEDVRISEDSTEDVRIREDSTEDVQIQSPFSYRIEAQHFRSLHDASIHLVV